MVTYLTVSLLGTLVRMRSIGRSERGQDLIEYSLLSGLIATGLILAAALLTGALSSMIDGIGNCIDFSAGTECM